MSNQWKLVMSLRMRWWCLLVQLIGVIVLATVPDWSKPAGPFFLLMAVVPAACYFAVTCSFGACGPNSGGNDRYNVEVPVGPNGEALATDALLPGAASKTIYISNYGFFGPMWLSIGGGIAGIAFYNRNFSQ
jgi:hypothetical protein